jgi:hypothetical protein
MKPHHHHAALSAEMPSSRQRLYTRYLVAILADLVVLGLFAEFWAPVSISGFSVGLLTAVLLQLLLQATLSLEHLVAGWFEGRGGLWTAGRYLSAWLILFGSKFVMLGVIERLLGDAVHFGGPMHGVMAFIVVIVAMLVAEEALVRIFRLLR